MVVVVVVGGRQLVGTASAGAEPVLHVLIVYTLSTHCE